MTRSMIRAAMLSILAAAVALPAQAETVRTEVAEYIGSGAFTAPTGCFYGLGDDPNIGGACFWVDEEEETVSVTLDDMSPLPVGGDLSFIGGGAVLGSVTFCDQILNAKIPAGSSQLIGSTDSATGALSCLGRGGPALGGTLTASFITP
jgi:hypothetical protein